MSIITPRPAVIQSGNGNRAGGNHSMPFACRNKRIHGAIDGRLLTDAMMKFWRAEQGAVCGAVR
jgi:hypothetical protein